MRIQLVIQRARLTFQGLHYLRIVGGTSRHQLSNFMQQIFLHHCTFIELDKYFL